jgi:flavin reductase (DIM6/NTAB) family NADH-FMN oxidoreductase RutF
VLSVAAAWLQCAVRQELELGSHCLVVGEIDDCGTGAPGQAPSEDTSEGIGELLRMEDTRMNYGG